MNNQRVIDTTSEAWLVFRGHWYVSEGFYPNERDSRVLRAWVWFLAGEAYGNCKRKRKKPAKVRIWG